MWTGMTHSGSGCLFLSFKSSKSPLFISAANSLGSRGGRQNSFTPYLREIQRGWACSCGMQYIFRKMQTLRCNLISTEKILHLLGFSFPLCRVAQGKGYCRIGVVVEQSAWHTEDPQRRTHLIDYLNLGDNLFTRCQRRERFRQLLLVSCGQSLWPKEALVQHILELGKRMVTEYQCESHFTV